LQLEGIAALRQAASTEPSMEVSGNVKAIHRGVEVAIVNVQTHVIIWADSSNRSTAEN
jgi:hypothetical protein